MMCERICLHKMPPLSLIISLFGRLPHCLQYEHGIFKGGLALERMGGGLLRGNWCVSSPLNDSLLLSVRTERREKIKKQRNLILYFTIEIKL